MSLVINFDLPTQPENYLHRIGRSGRFGRKGVAINFVSREDEHMLKDVQRFYNTVIEELPSNVAGAWHAYGILSFTPKLDSCHAGQLHLCLRSLESISTCPLTPLSVMCCRPHLEAASAPRHRARAPVVQRTSEAASFKNHKVPHRHAKPRRRRTQLGRAERGMIRHASVCPAWFGRVRSWRHC